MGPKEIVSSSNVLLVDFQICPHSKMKHTHMCTHTRVHTRTHGARSLVRHSNVQPRFTPLPRAPCPSVGPFVCSVQQPPLQ